MAAEFPHPLRPGSFRCPAHEDHSPSLSISRAPDGRWLVHCHAGCSTAAVLAAAGLTFEDLAPEGMPRRPRAIPPPAEHHESAAIIAEALAMDRAQVRRVRPEDHARNDLIRAKRRIADKARECATRWGPDDPATWVMAEIAAELDREVAALESGDA